MLNQGDPQSLLNNRIVACQLKTLWKSSWQIKYDTEEDEFSVSKLVKLL